MRIAEEISATRGKAGYLLRIEEDSSVSRVESGWSGQVARE